MKLMGIVAGLAAVLSPFADADETAPDDRTITFWVGESIREDPRVWAANIDISTRDGVVRLTGNVNTLMQRRYAGAIASKIHGVVRVINELNVVVMARDDDLIQADVQRRLALSSGVRIRNLKVASEKGVVTIAGEVSSIGYRVEAEHMVSEVPGVRDVRNSLTIRHQGRRSDDDIAAELTNTFFRDVYLTGLEIGVQCRNGNVTIDGVVGNDYQRVRAGQLAKNTTGVYDVLNEIRVNQLYDRGERRRATRPTNEELTEAIAARLNSDVRIDAAEIVVACNDGHVTLRGHVPTMLQRQHAEVTARQVTGAIWITNLLYVRDSLRPDDDLRRDIQRTLEDDPALRRLPVTADVNHGIVTLSGTVPTHIPRLRAAERIGRISGVRGLRNNIQVRWTSVFRDQTLKQHVKTRLRANWETAPVSDRIDVTVNSGNVVLTGDVDSWAQRREAGRMAFFTTGVRSVQNRVTINGVRYPWEDWNSESNALEPPPDWIHEFRGDFFERPGLVRM